MDIRIGRHIDYYLFRWRIKGDKRVTHGVAIENTKSISRFSRPEKRE